MDPILAGKLKKACAVKEIDSLVHGFAENILDAVNAGMRGPLNRFLGYLGRFGERERSTTNVALILLQKPDSCKVLGKTDWERLGYSVQDDAQKITVYTKISTISSTSDVVNAWFERNPIKTAISRCGGVESFLGEGFDKKTVDGFLYPLKVKWATKTPLCYPPHKPPMEFFRALERRDPSLCGLETKWNSWRQELDKNPALRRKQSGYYKARTVFDISDVRLTDPVKAEKTPSLSLSRNPQAMESLFQDLCENSRFPAAYPAIEMFFTPGERAMEGARRFAVSAVESLFPVNAAGGIDAETSIRVANLSAYAMALMLGESSPPWVGGYYVGLDSDPAGVLWRDLKLAGSAIKEMQREVILAIERVMSRKMFEYTEQDFFGSGRGTILESLSEVVQKDDDEEQFWDNDLFSR
jgi:hypothetical protein